MTTPIFVVGLNRSGTKWLSNELAKHPQIACVQNEKTGIRETNMFRGFGRKFDLNNLDEYIALIELWAASDFFQRTGVDKSLFYWSKPLPGDTLTLFGLLMNEFARLQGKPYWLQKAQPIAAFDLIQKFPDAYFVIIRRKLEDQVRSVCKLKSNRTIFNIARATFANVRENKLLDRLHRLTRCPIVDYDQLHARRGEEIAELLRKWNIRVPMPEENPGSSKVPNSSFQDGSIKSDYFGFGDRFVLRFVSGLARCIPFAVMKSLADRSWHQVGPIVPGTFANIEFQYPMVREAFGPSRHRSSSSISRVQTQAQTP